MHGRLSARRSAPHGPPLFPKTSHHARNPVRAAGKAKRPRGRHQPTCPRESIPETDNPATPAAASGSPPGRNPSAGHREGSATGKGKSAVAECSGPQQAGRRSNPKRIPSCPSKNPATQHRPSKLLQLDHVQLSGCLQPALAGPDRKIRCPAMTAPQERKHPHDLREPPDLPVRPPHQAPGGGQVPAVSLRQARSPRRCCFRSRPSTWDCGPVIRTVRCWLHRVLAGLAASAAPEGSLPTAFPTYDLNGQTAKRGEP